MKKTALCIVIILCFCVAYASASTADMLIEHKTKPINTQELINAHKTTQTAFNASKYLPQAQPTPKILPIERPRPSPYLIEGFTKPAIITIRPDYYSVEEIDPLPYILKTAPEKVSTWFVYSAGNESWSINWDAEARPLKYIGIHTAPNMSMQEMNAFYKNILYEPRYQSNDNDPYVKGLPAHSGHFVDGTESFSPFHYVIYRNGELFIGASPYLILKNGQWYVNQIVWSLGNWENNCEALSMCFILDDYPNSEPTQAQIDTANRIIDSIRMKVPNVEVAPHFQFNSQSNCPEGYNLWSSKLH